MLGKSRAVCALRRRSSTMMPCALTRSKRDTQTNRPIDRRLIHMLHMLSLLMLLLLFYCMNNNKPSIWISVTLTMAHDYRLSHTHTTDGQNANAKAQPLSMAGNKKKRIHLCRWRLCVLCCVRLMKTANNYCCQITCECLYGCWKNHSFLYRMKIWSLPLNSNGHAIRLHIVIITLTQAHFNQS